MAILGKHQEDEEMKRGVVADGDTLHLREVRESDAGTYVLRSVKYHSQHWLLIIIIIILIIITIMFVMVRAENSLGSARRSVRITVLHPPRFFIIIIIVM